MEEGQWMLQVAPASNPGFLGKLFGGAVSARPAETTELAKAIHAILATSERFSEFMWAWDGFPEADGSAPEPQPPHEEG